MRKASRRRAGNLREYVSYFLWLSLVLVFFVGFVQYTVSARAMRDTAGISNANTLKLLQNAHEAVLTQIEQSTSSLFTDPFFQNYMSYYHQGRYNILRDIYSSLSTIVSGNRSIRAVCIYYRGDGYTLSSDMGPAPVGDYHDSAFLLSLDTLDFRYTHTATRMVTYPWDMEAEPVITLVKTLPTYYVSGLPSAYVLIDIDRRYIDNTLKTITHNENVRVLVTDAEGRLLSSAGEVPSSLLETIDEAKLLGLPYEVYRVQGQDMLVSYTENAQNGWRYLLVRPLDMLVDMRGQTLLFMLVCAAGLLFSLPWSIALSRRIFKPIRQIFDRMPATGDDAWRGKETDRILHSVETMLESHRLMETKWQDSRLSAGQMDFWRILQDETPLPERREAIARLGIDGIARYILAVISSPSGGDTLLPGTTVYQLPSPEGRLQAALLHAFDAQGNPVLPARWPEGRFLGLSEVFTDLLALPEAYRQARFALDQRLAIPGQQVFRFDPAHPGETVHYPLAIEQDILAALSGRALSTIEAHLAAFTAHILARHAGPNTIRSFYLQLYCASQKYMMETGLAPQLLDAFGHETLIRMDSMQEMNIYLLGMYGILIEHAALRAGQKPAALAADVRAYIAEHLAGDLSMDALADRFGVSPSHLRKVFKDETNMTIKAYIDHLRIEKAQALLSQTGMKVQDIAVEVGFLSAQSFVKFFRGVVGITPGEYRNQAIRAMKDDHE